MSLATDTGPADTGHANTGHADTGQADQGQGWTQPEPPLFARRRVLAVPQDWVPTLLVIVDTEEEFDWAAPPNPANRAVTNIQLLPLLQAVFDRHGVVPAYLVDQPVTEAPEAVAVLRRIHAAGRCEIGAHLHPWLTPPMEETLDLSHAYSGNLPPRLERRKLQTLTAAIRTAFDTEPRIFRAGAYGIGPRTAGFLAELGYRVDSSVVPFTDFSAVGGPNFESMGGEPFVMAEGIVELPLTAGFAGHLSARGRTLLPRLRHPLARRLHLAGFAARLRLLERLRLTPEGHTLPDMMRLTRAALARRERLFMLTMHSSSLLPGATRYVRTTAEREAFLQRVDSYLAIFRSTLGGRIGVVSRVAAELAAP